MAHNLEIVANDGNLCGEAPLWDPAGRRLVWLDYETGLVFEHIPETGLTRVISRDLMVGGIALGRGGRLVFGGATGLHLWSRQAEYRTIAAEMHGEPLCVNDIIAGPRGQVYAGTFYWGPTGMEKPGRLVRCDPDGTVERRIALPVKQVSSLAFGGDDYADLYVTSAANAWTSPYAPPGYDFHAPNTGGALYRIRTDGRGRPEHVAGHA
jgi:D-xylonolactonase